MAPLFPAHDSLSQLSALNPRQDSVPTTGMPSGSIAAGGLHLSPVDTLGFCASVFGVIQFAGAILLKPAASMYSSTRPNKESLNELSEILHSWKDVLNNLDPEQKARFEIDRPGEFKSMMDAIDDYEEHLEDLNFDLRQSTVWARYLPKTQLSQTFSEVSGRIRSLDREYKVTTKNYRGTRGNQATAPTNGNTVPPLDTTPVAGNTDDVEMTPMGPNAAADEQRLINQYTIDQTERYRNIIRVYSNYNVPPAMQSTYLAIQNFMTSLLARPENSVVMLPV